jgi:hypothetical protein
VVRGRDIKGGWELLGRLWLAVREEDEIRSLAALGMTIYMLGEWRKTKSTGRSACATRTERNPRPHSQSRRVGQAKKKARGIPH